MYKSIDGANKALEEPVKEVEGRQVRCNLAAEGALNSGNKDKSANAVMTGTAVGDGQNRKVFFKSLDFSTSQDTVRTLCCAYGEVEHIQMKIDAAGRSNGMATVTFATVGAASSDQHTEVGSPAHTVQRRRRQQRRRYPCLPHQYNSAV